MTATVSKLNLLDFTDLDHFEAYLEEMARQGLFFQRAKFLRVLFRRGTPAPARYRMEPLGPLDTPEGQAHCRALGWQSAGVVGKFRLYMTLEPRAPELHTDPVVQSYGLDGIAKSMGWLCLLLALCYLPLVALLLTPLLLSEEPVTRLVLGSGLSFGLSLALELIAAFLAFRTIWVFFRLRRRLRAGGLPRRDGSWRRAAALSGGALLLSLTLLVSSLGGMAARQILAWEGESAAAERPFPALDLRNLEGNPRLETSPSQVSLKLFGTDWDNYVRFSWSPLAPQQYEVTQAMADGETTCRLDMEWYRLSLPFLASPLLDELAARKSRYGEYRLDELTLPGLDRAVLATRSDQTGQQLFLQAGGMVICLDYQGEGDLTAHPEALAALARWENRD